MVPMITIFIAVLVYYGHSQIQIQDWECGEFRSFTETITQFTGSNIIEICSNDELNAPKFSRIGTIWLAQPHFQTTDIYQHVFDEGVNCMEFNLTDSYLSYWHDCYKYTGDDTQLFDTFRLGGDASRIYVTIQNNCDASRKDCASADVQCGSTLKLTRRLLNKNKGACDTSTAPVYGTIGVFDNDIDDWVTRDLHSFVSSSSDDCSDYEYNNFDFYYIHNCESFRYISDPSEARSDTFELGSQPRYQILVTVNNNCDGASGSSANNCVNPTTSLTNITEEILISSDCADIAASPGGTPRSNNEQWNNAMEQFNICLNLDSSEEVKFIAKDILLNDIISSSVSTNSIYKSDLGIISKLGSNKVIMTWSEYFNGSNSIKYAMFADDDTNIDDKTVYQLQTSFGENNDMHPVISELGDRTAIAWLHISSSGTNEIRAVVLLNSIISNIYAEIQVSNVTPVASHIQIASIHGYFMIAWSDMNSSTGDINQYAKIYNEFGETITDIFTLSQEDVHPNIYGLSTGLFFVYGMCAHDRKYQCITMYDEFGRVKSINGESYFQNEWQGIFGWWMEGANIAELPDKTVLVLYGKIYMDAFHIEVTDNNNIVMEQQSTGIKVLRNTGIAEFTVIASSDTILHDDTEQYLFALFWRTGNLQCKEQLFVYNYDESG
eukprot:58135_1